MGIYLNVFTEENCVYARAVAIEAGIILKTDCSNSVINGEEFF